MNKIFWLWMLSSKKYCTSASYIGHLSCQLLLLFISGTISVMYLLGFVTYKTVLWGFHLDFTKVPGTCMYVVAYISHCIQRNKDKFQHAFIGSLLYPILLYHFSLSTIVHNTTDTTVVSKIEPPLQILMIDPENFYQLYFYTTVMWSKGWIARVKITPMMCRNHW